MDRCDATYDGSRATDCDRTREIDVPSVGGEIDASSPGRAAEGSLSARRWIIAFVAWSLIAGVTAAIPKIGGKAGELPVYTKAAARLMQGEQFYRTDDGPSFSYPPFACLVMTPIAALPQAWQSPAWWAINLLMLGGGLGLIVHLVLSRCPRFDESTRAAYVWLGVLFAVLGTRWWISPAEYRSNDGFVFLFGMLSLFAMTKNRDMQAGVWMGLAAASKATPLLFLPVFLLQRRWRASAGFMLAGVVATLLPDLLFPSAERRLWVLDWYTIFVAKTGAGVPAEAAGAWTAWNHLNQGLSGTLYRLMTHIPSGAQGSEVCWMELSPLARKLLILSAQCGVLGLVLLLAWQHGQQAMSRERDKSVGDQSERFTDLALAGVVFAAMLLLSPMSSKQHFVTLILPLAVCLAEAVFQPRNRWTMGLVVVLFLVGSVTTKDLIGRDWGNWFLSAGSLTFCTLILLGGSARLTWGRTDRAAIHVREGTPQFDEQLAA